MFFQLPTSVTMLFTLTAFALYPTIILAQQNCYRARKPFASTCALPNLHAMRQTLCSSTANWGEGFPFLSGHGVVLRLQDNCTTDNAPLGIDLTMTISSTVKDRGDCFNRTLSIIEKCVDTGGPITNGGEWYDLEKPDETFIWMQYLHIDPPATPDPCYDYPPPSYCTGYTEMAKKKDWKNSALDQLERRKALSMKGTHIDVDIAGNVLRKRFVSGDGTVVELE
ncbi:hypothetical protein K505DRAFT_326106 [Melanomma pulvis-pyrius CBS 109.77]|uniref:Ecp2 effector protein domain-containing protein n=1 Tax=Melanomma pulvis-pyrius CBS 109.77 TaxID=1314802 RepID=A0A6A6X8E8_9PLEO|nr:hypothetical protein K505DRAFT_326106 [Melanomma pulvis-pyrius CBS 109.77]